MLKPGWYRVDQPASTQPYHKFNGLVGVYAPNEGGLFFYEEFGLRFSMYIDPEDAHLYLSEVGPGKFKFAVDELVRWLGRRGYYVEDDAHDFGRVFVTATKDDERIILVFNHNEELDYGEVEKDGESSEVCKEKLRQVLAGNGEFSAWKK